MYYSVNLIKFLCIKVSDTFITYPYPAKVIFWKKLVDLDPYVMADQLWGQLFNMRFLVFVDPLNKGQP